MSEPDEPSHDDREHDDDRDHADRRAPFQDKADADARPDRPTPSDEATLVERDEGAHAEFVDAPSSMEDADSRDRSHRSGDESDESRG